MTSRQVMVVLLIAGVVASGCSSSDDRASAPTPAVQRAGTVAPAGSSAPTDAAGTVPAAAAVPSTPPPSAAVSVAVTDASTTASTSPTRDRCSPDDAAGTVVIWDSLGAGAGQNALDALIAEFNASHAVQIQRTHVGGYPDALVKLADTPTDQWPNILIAGDKATRALLDSEDFLRPSDCVDDTAMAAALLPAVRDRWAVQDRLAAVPFGVSTPVLVFDANEYAAAGLDPATPLTSLDELLAASRQIVARGASPHGLVLDDSCTSLVAEQYASRRGELLSPPSNGHELEPMHVGLATPENIDALTALRSGVQDGDVVYLGPNGGGYDDLTKIIDGNDGATMAIHTSAALGDLLLLFANGSFNGAALGVLPLPGPGAGGPAGGNAMWLVDHGDPVVNGSAWSVIDWLAAPAQLARFDAATGYVPTSAAVAGDPATAAAWAAHPQLKIGYDQLAAAPDSMATGGLLLGASTDSDSAMFATCTAIMQDGQDPAAALAALTDAVNGLIDIYGGAPAVTTATPGSTPS